MAVTETNRLRFRHILIGREVKWLFMAVPTRFAEKILRRWFVGMVWRWLFLSPEGEVTRAGEVLLSELRDRYMLGTAFSSDPLIMARNCGRREVVQEIIDYLNLDEYRVQQLMRLDDGLD